MKRGFIPYDGFKLVIAILLLLAIILRWQSSSPKVAPAPEEPAAEEVVTVENTAVPEPTKAPEPTEVPVEEEPAEPEVKLPPFPEPSDGFSYDADSGFVVNANGQTLYQLNEDGYEWVPLVPDELGDLKLSPDGDNQWVLLDDQGAPKYNWDFATHSWVEVPQEEVAEEDTAKMEITPCESAAPARLVPGEKAQVASRLNFRSSAGIANDNWMETMDVGTTLKVLGETICTPYGNGAYLWWNLEKEDGTVGWAAEAHAVGTNYFLDPAK